MADEPTLPRIRASKTADAIFGTSRKRVRPDLLPSPSQLLNNSSDPAVFSSDDDPALDNYAPDHVRRKKKRYVGAWFAQHPASTDSTFDEGEAASDAAAAAGASATVTLPIHSSPVRPQPKKRTFERQFDSGVWMGGEGKAGGNEEDDNDLLEQAMAESPPASLPSTSSQLSLAPPPPLPAKSDFPPPPPRQQRVFHRVPSLAVNSAEAKARSMIQACIEAGDEEISLMGLGLTSLSNATVEPLSGLVPIPVVTEGVAFEQKDPQLRLYLSNNELTRLPGAIFNFEHLTVLTLRNNRLRELPPAIGQLKNLKTLNVSQNKLRYLPAELLLLIRTYGQGGHLRELLVHPNRYFAPDDGPNREVTEDAGCSSRDSEVKSRKVVHNQRTPRLMGEKPTRVARSPVRYMDSLGKTWSRFAMEPAKQTSLIPTEDMSVAPVPPWSTLPHLARSGQTVQSSQNTKETEIPTLLTPPPTQTTTSAPTALTASRVPTLVELALEACYKTPQLGQLPDMLPLEAPSHLGPQLARALERRDAGGMACSVCHRSPLVAPMTEWIEWWEFAKSDINCTTANATRTFAGLGAPDAAGSGSGVDVAGPNEVDVLPFIWRGCSWGCVPVIEAAEEA